ncbi:hypothetical protein Tco_0923812 [Tanacetum coccineum]|uniref:Reverse transcriptase domain-containing protein n=1 Tax=Tanacetum coccineum TaxID=301880 RepID=A0ABQ5D4D1_9ASTR
MDKTMAILMVQSWQRVIAISIQWDYREARSEENSGSPVNRSWNVKIPSYKRNTNITKQQDVHSNCTVDLRTGSTICITQATEKRIKVSIHSEYLEQTIAVGSTQTEYGRKALFGLLRRNLDIFAWKPEDMTRVPQHLAEHRLNVREGCPPIRQKKRSQELERNKAIQEEVEKLVRRRHHEGSPLPQLVIKSSNGKKARQQLEDVCGLQRPK